MTKTTLFCLPYAGGSSSIYASWKSLLDEDIKLVPLELAGRGKRFSQPLYRHMDEAVEDLIPQVRTALEQGPAAVMGYSMGSLIAFELAHRLMMEFDKRFTHLFLAAKGAPHTVPMRKPLHSLEEQEFKQEVLHLGGTPPQLFEIQDLADLFIPLLRADLKVVETYECEGGRGRLDSDFTLFMGSKDDIPEEDMRAWELHTSGTCTLHCFEGGHFFPNEHKHAMVRHINDVLSRQASYEEV